MKTNRYLTIMWTVLSVVLFILIMECVVISFVLLIQPRPRPVTVVPTLLPTQGARMVTSYAPNEPPIIRRSVYPAKAVGPVWSPTTCVASIMPGPVMVRLEPRDDGRITAQLGTETAAKTGEENGWTRIWMLGVARGWVDTKQVQVVPCEVVQ